MNLGAPGEHENDTEAKIEEEAPQQLPLEDEPLRKGFAASANEDGTGMEMDDASYRIDGNARPSKRISRR
jgi:hypothetical protein